ncbi:hypothetical protein HMN09_00210500 [Mycena chlorophos]|uniref:Uncharacterized protein n=1 Tax=Mycena chlorophos TaxID=658473 RepID=A0A8H6TLI0_MYCCL|nr:hypothetical protein HMN09_00210500 [Mycena chlorophos]
MPELRETTASGLIALHGFRLASAQGTDWTLLGIECDATKQEAKKAGATERARQGLVYALHDSSKVQRGQRSHQSPVYPQILEEDEELESLALRGLESTHRALILDMGPAWLMVQYLTHTSVQWYRRSAWNSTIRNVSKEVRGFHIGMALVFRDWVLAFPTIDLLFQPTWVRRRAELSIPPCVYDNFHEFVGTIAQWVEDTGMLASKSRKLGTQRACEAIRNANKVWYGIGVYTVCELMFFAGISPFITLREFVRCPSRVARFVSALWMYIHVGSENQKLWELIRPCIRDTVLAPTKDQRLRYAQAPWLHVWARERAYMTNRMAELVKDHNTTIASYARDEGIIFRDQLTDLHDPFEPTFVAAALQSQSNLGALIFGSDEWVSMGGTHSARSDALTELYSEYGLLESPTHLRPGYYQSELFLASEELCRAWCKTLTFTGDKNIWTVVTEFPSNMRLSSLPRRDLCRAGQVLDRASLLFRYIVLRTLGVSIGPLEYCGNGYIIHDGGNVVHVALCRGDPNIPLRLEERRVLSDNRITTKLDAPGQLKRARTDKENTAVVKAKRALEAGYKRAGTLAVVSAPVADGPPKKKRKSTDLHMASGTL